MRFLMGRSAVALLVITAAGCLSPRAESPPTHTYQLSLGAEHADPRPADLKGPVLLVSPLQAEPGFETPWMVYVRRPYELEHYAVNQWADTPARMITALMVQKLDRTGIWRAVVPLPSSVRGDYRFDAHGVALRQEFLQQPSRVRVTVHAQLVDVKESRVVGARTFEAMENAPSEDAYGGVVAANRAVADLLDRVAAWLQECVRRSPECGH
jgi:cholesterol transport system auxiliary component